MFQENITNLLEQMVLLQINIQIILDYIYNLKFFAECIIIIS